ncbi:hypothetical protein M427DRAFT_54192 [Gonapodya prolifera JEL478]|uniref:Uncharacterized protein n=1 Tax=Gonapodya prolifera (strain JEL478) TaxID=1344416 RepID=A0A139AN73_GONPJ|nr:hypothetical protein M427DRAFT_54192 [Gonapodya prolifera JEL478]|eukprot:KXS17973.1 hypothetical protein M427DRAFT_54192 [Gonapodya prolifera JEL478]
MGSSLCSLPGWTQRTGGAVLGLCWAPRAGLAEQRGANHLPLLIDWRSFESLLPVGKADATPQFPSPYPSLTCERICLKDSFAKAASIDTDLSALAV